MCCIKDGDTRLVGTGLGDNNLEGRGYIQVSLAVSSWTTICANPNRRSTYAPASLKMEINIPHLVSTETYK